MRVSCSSAEEQVAVALHQLGLKGWFKNREIVLEATIPDFWFPAKKVAVYLDGEQVHSSSHALERDDRITAVLEKRGVRVLRFRYRPPLSKKCLAEIVESIMEAVGHAEA
jgi:very-short-patch-repair endonuclease